MEHLTLLRGRTFASDTMQGNAHMDPFASLTIGAAYVGNPVMEHTIVEGHPSTTSTTMIKTRNLAMIKIDRRMDALVAALAHPLMHKAVKHK